MNKTFGKQMDKLQWAIDNNISLAEWSAIFSRSDFNGLKSEDQ